MRITFKETFLVILIIVQLIVTFDQETYWFVSLLVKPLISLFILIFYTQDSQDCCDNSKFRYFMQAGLLFAVFGDLFIVFHDESKQTVKPALIMFAITHLMYCIAFVINIKNDVLQKKKQVMQIPLAVLVGEVVLVFIIRHIYYKYFIIDIEDRFRPHYNVYTILIATMASLAILRFNKTPQKSYNRLLAGALLFSFSDLIIGVHLFGDLKGTWVDIVFQIVYYYSQYLICQGAFYHGLWLSQKELMSIKVKKKAE